MEQELQQLQVNLQKLEELVARWNTDKLAPKWTNRPLPKWLGLDKEGKYCYIGIDD